jgi:Ca-activated chloride channel family protein
MRRILLSGSARTHDRRGAANVLIAAMLLVFLIAAAMSIDFAYMQLVRTELRTATDAAAKAGAEALARTQDANAAKAAAVAYANLNKVGGRTYQINTNDVTLGRVTGQTDGTWTFTANTTPYNSVRVNSKIGNGGATAAFPTFFGGALGHADFATSQQATASQQEVEVCLCLDRSGSMMFDMSGDDWSYASGNPSLYSSSYYPGNSIYRDYCSPPHPTLSRWAVLQNAVRTFLDEAGQFQYPPRTAVVTWSNSMSLPYHPYTSYNTVDTDFNLPSAANFSWSSNRGSVENTMAARAAVPLGGGTNLSAGLDRAVQVLTGTNGRALSNKIIILLTDGQWNAGGDPVLAAQDASTAGITIHTISMLTSSQATLTQVASITGGRYYPTSNAAQLQQAFRDIAKSLPIVLTD